MIWHEMTNNHAAPFLTRDRETPLRDVFGGVTIILFSGIWVSKRDGTCNPMLYVLIFQRRILVAP
jgi:hypothetical protein